MDAKQINTMMGRLVEHQSEFSGLPTADGQWAIQNPKEAIAIFNNAIKNRSKPIELLLEFLGTISIPAISNSFIARDHFVIDTSKKAKVKISYLGDNFKYNFLEKIDEPFAGSTIRYGKLKKNSVDAPIIAELGGEEKSETSLVEMFALIGQQPSGKSGALLTDGYVNIFYIRDKNRVLWAVRCGWNGVGWSMNAYSVDRPPEWRGGDQVFSRSSFFLQKFYDILFMKSCDTQWLRLLRHGFGIFFVRVVSVKTCARV
ncbi:MAG: hypothetical protein WA055_04030 [Candidatus Moraniibacteriota bacterium]